LSGSEFVRLYKEDMPSVTIIGDAFIDVMVPVSGISPGATYHREITTRCGGTANVAFCLSRLGKEDICFVGRVGDDAQGAYFRNSIKAQGVRDLTFLDSNRTTGLCLSLVFADGERAMIANRGANDGLTIKEVDTCFQSIQESKIAYFSGYSLLYNAESIYYLMRKLKRKCEIWFNPGAPNIVQNCFRDTIGEIVDVLVLNRDEARRITGKEETDQMVAELGKMVNLAAVTLGREGCIVARDGGWITVSGDTLLTGVNTTGAGDAFAAGFIAGRLKNLEDVECARLANKVAVDFLLRKE
jgi:sugar/nucleoside kinase (ribokinase family)